MIAFFPSLYPDELVYSWFARYFAKSGYPAYTDAFEDIYGKRILKPSFEFINPLGEKMISIIEQEIGLEQLMLKHTMFPLYARFLPANRRTGALRVLVEEQNVDAKLLGRIIDRKGVKRYARFCPQCAKEDREKYGETYWHRLHQIVGIDICAKHGFRLFEANVALFNRSAPRLYPAETVEDVAIASDDPGNVSNVEIELARYAATVFNTSFDMNNDVGVGKFLHSRLAGGRYLSLRGQQRDMETLLADYNMYYDGLETDKLMESWQLQKLFNGKRIHFMEVCQLAMFLEINVSDLVSPVLPEERPEELFDAKVKRLRAQKMSYQSIAQEMGVGLELVKAVGEDRYTKRKKGSKVVLDRYTRRKCDFAVLDEKLLPEVENICRAIYYGVDGSRPKKVGVHTVQSMLELPEKQLYSLTRCLKAIRRYDETQEHYWAREIIWAVRRIVDAGDKLTWRHIRNLTNLRRANFLKAIPEVEQIASSGMWKLIKEIV